MYVPIEVLLGSRQARMRARSALPDAPVEPSTPRTAKARNGPRGRGRGAAAPIPRAREVTTLDA